MNSGSIALIGLVALLATAGCATAPAQPQSTPAQTTAAEPAKGRVCTRQPPTLGSRVGEMVCEEAD